MSVSVPGPVFVMPKPPVELPTPVLSRTAEIVSGAAAATSIVGVSPEARLTMLSVPPPEIVVAPVPDETMPPRLLRSTRLRVWMSSVPLDATKFMPGDDLGAFLTESYRAILPQSAVRRIVPPVMNIYGTVLLAGGAIYSGMLFARKEILPHRVLGNTLIAVGGILPALGGSLIKLAETTPMLSEWGSVLKYLGIFLGLLVLFAGFQVIARGATASSPSARAISSN